jgi:hypothetical protein
VVGSGGCQPAHPSSNPGGEVCGVAFLKNLLSCQSASVTPTHVALSWVAVPLCKGGTGVHGLRCRYVRVEQGFMGFFRPAREDLVFFPQKINLLLNHHPCLTKIS